jgi:proteasome lid subunit RPN8/RPN11
MSGESMSMSIPPLPRSVLEAIYQAARIGYPEEVCGFIVGQGDAAVARPCVNRQNELHAKDPATFTRDARTAYNLGREDLQFLEKSLGTDQPVTIIYHSHCDVGAYFSEEDKRAATPWDEPLYPVDYLVIDAQKDGVKGGKLFRWVDNDFVEVAAFDP